MPPRAGKNKTAQSLRHKSRLKFPRLFKFIESWPRIPGDHLIALALSLLPGLGQLYLGERRKAAVFFLTWLAPFAIGAYLYHSYPRLLLLLSRFLWAAAMLAHTRAAMDALKAKLHCRTFWEVRIIYIFLIACFATLYYLIGSALQGRLVVYVTQTVFGIL